MALPDEVLAELKAESAARRRKSAEAPAQDRCNALEARINRLEAAHTGNSNPFSESFWADIAKGVRQFIDKRCATLEARIKELESQPQTKYMDVYKPGAMYSEGSEVTFDGSLFHANKTTKEIPGSGCPDWQLKVKRGRDGKDAK